MVIFCFFYHDFLFFEINIKQNKNKMFECFEFENGGTGGFASSTDLARRAGPVAEGDPHGYQLSALLSNPSIFMLLLRIGSNHMPRPEARS